jgi:hypothetical protein
VIACRRVESLRVLDGRGWPRQGGEQTAESVNGGVAIANPVKVGAKWAEYLPGLETAAGLVDVECSRSVGEDDFDLTLFLTIKMRAGSAPEWEL